MSATLEQPARHVKSWTKTEFYAAVEAGVFGERRVELIRGDIIEMAAMLGPHARAIMNTQARFHRAFDTAVFGIRTQMPLDLGQTSQPEPDIAIVRSEDVPTTREHPTTALLVVEVSDSTLSDDRTVKAPLYAEAGIAEYWIVNIPGNRLEVRRNPAQDPSNGFDYRDIQTLDRNASVSPLFAPEVTLRVNDLLP